MQRLALALAIGACWLASVAVAAPGGVPAHPRSVGDWGFHDPETPDPGYEPWGPRDAAGFLELHPDAFLGLGINDGKPPGNGTWRRSGALVDQLQAITAQRGIAVRQRLCVNERPDVLIRLADNVGSCQAEHGAGCDWEGSMNGRHGESETVVKVARLATAGTPDGLVDTTQRWARDLYAHRLLVLRPGSPTEERRRVIGNGESFLTVDQPWRVPPEQGDAYEVRGSFDPAWVKRVPRSEHVAALQRFWSPAGRFCGGRPCVGPAEPLDPFDPANERGWERWVNRPVFESLLTPTSVPALYGNVSDADDDSTSIRDPFYRTNAVVMDVSNPDYREWRARYALYKIEDFGLEPGDAPCMRVSYKPGLHTYYDPSVYGPPNDPCHEEGTHNWVGPAHVCGNGEMQGGPLHPTPFRPGEYEVGISAYFRALFAALAAGGHGDARIITAETPSIGAFDWTALADDVRRHPMLYGEQGGWIDPPLESLAALPGAGASDGAPPADGASSDPDPGTPDPSPTPAPAPAPAPPTSTASGGGSVATGGGHPPASAGGSAATAATPRRAPRAGFVASSGSGGGGGTIEPPKN